jgi:hypothetical protein
MIEVGAVYRHYKGNRYRVLHLAKHSETLKDLVIYECLYENPAGKIWARPLEMWGESVSVNGSMILRFKKEKGESV